MTEPSKTDMLSAARLTRQGRIAEATASLQKTLGIELSLATAVRAPRTATVRPLANRALPDADPSPRGEFFARCYRGGAGNRDYKLYVPAGHSTQPRPLVVMLHGCTQSPDDFAIGTGMNALADVHEFLVAYPAQSMSANSSRCWNWYDPSHQSRGGGEPSLIAGMVREIQTLYAVDPRRIYAAGLSAGGAAAAVLGATYPDLFAAIGIHSGLACGSAHDLRSAFSAMNGQASGAPDGGRARGPSASPRRVPTIVFQGDRDSTVHPSNAKRVLDAGGATGLTQDVTTGQVAGGRAYTRTSYADEAGRSIHELWVCHGAGHAWSGGSGLGSYTDPTGPDATKEMIRFFLAHPQGATNLP